MSEVYITFGFQHAEPRFYRPTYETLKGSDATSKTIAVTCFNHLLFITAYTRKKRP